MSQDNTIWMGGIENGTLLRQMIQEIFHKFLCERIVVTFEEIQILLLSFFAFSFKFKAGLSAILSDFVSNLFANNLISWIMIVWFFLLLFGTYLVCLVLHWFKRLFNPTKLRFFKKKNTIINFKFFLINVSINFLFNLSKLIH